MAHTNRQVRAWRLTADGEAAIDTHHGGRALSRAQRKVGKGGKPPGDPVFRPDGPGNQVPRPRGCAG